MPICIAYVHSEVIYYRETHKHDIIYVRGTDGLKLKMPKTKFDRSHVGTIRVKIHAEPLILICGVLDKYPKLGEQYSFHNDHLVYVLDLVDSVTFNCHLSLTKI